MTLVRCSLAMMVRRARQPPRKHSGGRTSAWTGDAGFISPSEVLVVFARARDDKPDCSEPASKANSANRLQS
jgi:hypothetical protein